MTLVTWKALCIDASDVSAVAGFWANALDWTAQELDDGDAIVRSHEPGEEIAVLLVPEPRTVKQRVHLDVRAESLDRFAGLERLTAEGEFAWTVMADPEGGEFCVFLYDEPPPVRLKAVGVDAADHRTIAAWWADLLGGTLFHGDEYTSVEDIPGSTLGSIDFAPVPEPKTVKNRIHWDVTLTDGSGVDDLVAAGATVLRAEDDEIGWTVMADPESNEFCVFERRRGRA
jgi:hypothetical protein